MSFDDGPGRKQAVANGDASAYLKRDPVCGMWIDARQAQHIYRGIGYVFCSMQCRERFVSAPRLYVGRRGLPAPKQQGIVMIKRTRIAFAPALSAARFCALKRELLSMMGVIDLSPIDFARGARPDRGIDAVVVTYDLLQATALQLERRAVEMSATLSHAWGERLQRDCVHYLESCELGDLEVRDAGPESRVETDLRRI